MRDTLRIHLHAEQEEPVAQEIPQLRNGLDQLPKQQDRPLH